MRVIFLFRALVSVSFRRLSNRNPTAEPRFKLQLRNRTSRKEHGKIVATSLEDYYNYEDLASGF